jgi:hypothetical protein
MRGVKSWRRSARKVRPDRWNAWEKLRRSSRAKALTARTFWAIFEPGHTAGTMPPSALQVRKVWEHTSVSAQHNLGDAHSAEIEAMPQEGPRQIPLRFD